MMTAEEAVATLSERLLPGSQPIGLAVALVVGWVAGLRLQWRRDRRETQESVAALMVKLVDQQRAELTRHIAEGDALRRQVELFVDGRWQLQQALDTLREQVIAARVMIHDYERQLGIKETEFPPLAAPSLVPRTRLDPL